MKQGTPGFVSHKLREAREARGLSATSLADLLDVSRQAVSQYETGKHSPSPEVLGQISKTLNLPRRFFFNPETYEPSTVFYRSFKSATKSERKRSERRIGWRRNIIKYIDKFVEFNKTKVYDPKILDPLVLSDDDIERIAREARRFWGIGDGVISDILLLMENNGIVVSREEVGSEKLDGFSEWKDGCSPIVVLSTDKGSAVRSRFDAAHELGHLIIHKRISRDKLSGNIKVFENQANKFASSFLLPAESFLDEFRSPSLSVFRALKPKWKVSIQSMVVRSRNLGVIDKKEYSKLYKKMSYRGWIKEEPLDNSIEAEEPRLLKRSIELLLDSGVQTREDVVNSLPYSRSDIEQLTGLRKGYLHKDGQDQLRQPRLRRVK